MSISLQTPKDYQLFIAVVVICTAVVIIVVFATTLDNYRAILVRDQELNFFRKVKCNGHMYMGTFTIMTVSLLYIGVQINP